MDMPKPERLFYWCVRDVVLLLSLTCRIFQSI